MVGTFLKAEEQDKMNSQIISTTLKSVILFQDFRKEIKLFTWNA